MEVLSNKYVGIICICEECGSFLANIQESDICAENIVYCPVCKHGNHILYNKNYDGIVQENKNDV